MPPSNKFMQLLKDNAQAKARAPFRAEVKGGEATLYLYDVIVSDDYFGGVCAESFVKELQALDADVIHLRINSPAATCSPLVPWKLPSASVQRRLWRMWMATPLRRLPTSPCLRRGGDRPRWVLHDPQSLDGWLGELR